MTGLKSNVDRALMACSLWLHIAFIGATGLAAGLILLFSGEASWPVALSVTSAGAMLAVACWRRSLAVLRRVDRAAPAADRATLESPAHPATTGPARRKQRDFGFSTAAQREALR